MIIGIVLVFFMDKKYSFLADERGKVENIVLYIIHIRIVLNSLIWTG